MITLKKNTPTEWVEYSDAKFKIDYPKMEQIHKLQDIQASAEGIADKKVMLEYARYYLKFTIKDWDGLDVPCKIVNNELEDELWYALTENIEHTFALFAIIDKALSWKDTDKKKLNSSQD